MAREEHLQYLAAVSLFAHCPMQQLKAIIQKADELNVPAGTMVTRQGDSLSTCWSSSTELRRSPATACQMPLSAKGGSSENWCR